MEPMPAHRALGTSNTFLFSDTFFVTEGVGFLPS